MRQYRQNFILLTAVILGSCCGWALGERAQQLKPFGDIFLGLLLTAVVPYVFFSISSAVAVIPSGHRLGKILATTLAIFVVTGVFASLFMLLAVKLFPPHQGLVGPSLPNSSSLPTASWGELLVKTVSTADFIELFSKKNLLPMIIFSVIFGWAISLAKEAGRPLLSLIEAGTAVMSKLITIIMYYAPIGLFCYFAYLIGVFGPDLLGVYARTMAIYYPVALLYFLFGFSFYAAWARGPHYVPTFWKNLFAPTLTALATGSSVATLPVNLEAAEKNSIPKDIRELVLPIGATIHMDGSCLSAILKISLLLGIYRGGFVGLDSYVISICVALVSSTVMAGIPGGGFLGEILILNLYNFPPESYAILLALGTLVDPIATVVNSTGDNVAAMMVAKILNKKT